MLVERQLRKIHRNCFVLSQFRSLLYYLGTLYMRTFYVTMIRDVYLHLFEEKDGELFFPFEFVHVAIT